jgi:inorganic triphosphatase YgiF
MIEAELKILLDEPGLARLRRAPALAALRTAPRRTQTLVSVYYDTADQALAAAGVSLRLRRVGRSWVQTVKRRQGGTASSGFFAHEEFEIPAPGGRLALGVADPEGALAAVRAAAAGAPIGPVFETRVRRTSERLKVEAGEVELALDEGEIQAGEHRTPIREAELELLSGEIGAIFAVARRLFQTGPVRFAGENKAARGYALARTGTVPTALAPRTARTLPVEADATVETVARDFFRDCLAQVADNLAVIAESDESEGPHQLRVGLRRLRTGFAVFGPTLGAESMAALAEAAKHLGQVVGRLRDADVLVEEVVAHAAGNGLDAAAGAALGDVLEARRRAVRSEVRAVLAGREAVGFVFDLAAFIEGRGWLTPSDYTQTERLAAPIGTIAPAILDARHKKVRKSARGIRDLDAEGLHGLRKQLKKLRYAVDMLGPIYKDGRVGPYLKSLKALQDSFGSLNDAAMAHAALTGPDAPGRDDAAAQRAVGWTLGTLAVRSEQDRPALFERWDRLAETKRFWR